MDPKDNGQGCAHKWEAFKGLSGLTMWRCERCDARSFDKPAATLAGK